MEPSPKNLLKFTVRPVGAPAYYVELDDLDDLVAIHLANPGVEIYEAFDSTRKVPLSKEEEAAEDQAQRERLKDDSARRTKAREEADIRREQKKVDWNGEHCPCCHNWDYYD